MEIERKDHRRHISAGYSAVGISCVTGLLVAGWPLALFMALVCAALLALSGGWK